MKIGDNIKRKRIFLGLTQSQLAEKCGWEGSSRISHYEKNVREPTLSDISRLAKALDLNPKELIFSSLSKLENEVSVLTWESVTDHFVHNKKLSHEDKKTIPAPHSISEKAFALKIKDDSMISSGGKSFIIGEYIIIDPDKIAKDGDFVLAYKKGTPEVVFRKYVIDAGTPYLYPLNTQRKEILIDKNVTICGVFVASFYTPDIDPIFSNI